MRQEEQSMAQASDHAQLLRTFFARWAVSFEELCQSMRDSMAEDCLFQQTRLPDLVGPRATIEFLKQARAAFGFETFEVQVRTLIAQDRWVACERVDDMKDARGRTLATFPAVCIMEIKDGKIRAWRDYFDSADMPAPAKPAAR
jgi:limonene-1,2-epoxide hydrolase